MHWLLNSSIGRKVIMSVSGIFLVLFLLFHMCANLVLAFSTEAYDNLSAFLGSNWYAVAATIVLAAGFVVHIIYATLLTLQNRKARGADRYASSNKTRTEWASKNMYILGVIVLAGLVLHLLQFWYKMQFSELFHLIDEPTAASILVIEVFSKPVYTVIYLIWLVAIWFHLTHGFWSAMHSLGLDNKVWFPRLKWISNILATLIMIGFAVVPVLFTIRALMA